MSSIKNKLIIRLNNDFNLDIPLNYPAVTHQKGFKDCGGFSWYFKGDNMEINKYGSAFSMTACLNSDKLGILEHDFNYEIVPEKI